MAAVVEVRNIKIGEGVPKIIVPIVGEDITEICCAAEVIKNRHVQMVEWRADFFEDVFNADEVVKALESLRSILGNMPILFTFRTDKEGGQKAISNEDYINLNTTVAQSGYADLVDVEIFRGDDTVKQIIKSVHDAKCLVVASNHDFNKTPEKKDIIDRLIKMQDMNADILKIAVMPNDTGDLLTLLAATYEMTSKYARKPVVTMSMSKVGSISRVTGEAFGSAMTFGMVGKNSAPGQIEVNDLFTMLEILHGVLQ